MQSNPVYILGIESSCDDTAAAVFKNDKLLSNIVANQTIHKAYGGVVPELASRAHQQNIIPVVSEALNQAKVEKNQLSAIAFTQGPGLMGSLLVGASFAKATALALNIPLIEVNHMQAHVLAHLINDNEKEIPEFPFLCLTVSGGHTQIVLAESPFKMHVLGETTDDAAGEAFDKAAKILGLPYPGGPLIDKFGQKGNPHAFKFPEPEIAGLNFSFSGLKTAFINFINRNSAIDSNFKTANLNDICASIEYTIIHILLNKLTKASKQTGIKRVAIAGGVSANNRLRQTLKEMQEQQKWDIFIPRFEYCTDNAAMIAITGYYKYIQQEFASQNTAANPRLHI